MAFNSAFKGLMINGEAWPVMLRGTVRTLSTTMVTLIENHGKMAEGRLPKIALNWMPKRKRARGKPKKNWIEGITKAMDERNLNEGQWEDRKQWSLGVGQRRKTF